MQTINQRTSGQRRESQIYHLLGTAECAAIVGDQAHLQPHACERLSPFEQRLLQQSPGERELSKLISGQSAEAQ